MKRSLIWFLFLAILASGVFAAIYFAKRNVHSSRALTIGDVVDSLNGVYVYYNGPISNVTGRNRARDGYNLGLKYQCVEFVKRYYYQYLKHKMPDSYGHAKDFFDKNIADGAMNKKRNLLQFINPSQSQPMVGDLIVFDGNIYNSYGHVAIISAVEDGRIEIIQQNPGATAFSRIKIGLKNNRESWNIKRSDCLGWLRKN